MTKQIIIWSLNLLLLVMVLQVNAGELLCVDQNGHIEYESFCHPETVVTDIAESSVCCSEVEDFEGCSDCYELEFENSVWTHRSKTDFYFYDHLSQIQIIQTAYNHLNNSIKLNTQKILFLKTQPPLSNAAVNSSTVLIC